MMVTCYGDKHQRKDQSSGRLCTEFDAPSKGLWLWLFSEAVSYISYYFIVRTVPHLMLKA